MIIEAPITKNCNISRNMDEFRKDKTCEEFFNANQILSNICNNPDLDPQFSYGRNTTTTLFFPFFLLSRRIKVFDVDKFCETCRHGKNRNFFI